MGLLNALAAGLGGAFGSMADSIGNEQKRAADMDLLRERERLEGDRQKMILNLQNDMANRQRAEQAARIDAAQNSIVDKAMDKKYLQSDDAVRAANAGETDAPLTDEQRAVISQARQADHDRLMDDSHTRIAAAIKSGDIDPKTMATLTSREDINQMRAENFAEKVAMQERVARANADAALDRVTAKADAAREIAEMKLSFTKLGGEKASPKMQTITYMEAHPELFTKAEIHGVMLDRPSMSAIDIATKIMSSDPNAGTKRAMSVDDAVAKANALITALRPSADSPAPKAPVTIPSQGANPRKPFDPVDFQKH